MDRTQLMMYSKYVSSLLPQEKNPGLNIKLGQRVKVSGHAL